MRIIAVLMLLSLSACDHAPMREIVDVIDIKIPILERAKAPEELYRVKLNENQIPLWVAPNNPAATTCLTKEGEPLLKSIIIRNESLLDGWEAYGSGN